MYTVVLFKDDVDVSALLHVDECEAGELTDHESSLSAKIATRGTPSGRMRPRYIPGVFNGIATAASI